MGFKATPAGFVHTSIFCPQNILLLLAKDHTYIPKAGTYVQFASLKSAGAVLWRPMRRT